MQTLTTRLFLGSSKQKLCWLHIRPLTLRPSDPGCSAAKGKLEGKSETQISFTLSNMVVGTQQL